MHIDTYIIHTVYLFLSHSLSPISLCRHVPLPPPVQHTSAPLGISTIAQQVFTGCDVPYTAGSLIATLNGGSVRIPSASLARMPAAPAFSLEALLNSLPAVAALGGVSVTTDAGAASPICGPSVGGPLVTITWRTTGPRPMISFAVNVTDPLVPAPSHTPFNTYVSVDGSVALSYIAGSSGLYTLSYTASTAGTYGVQVTVGANASAGGDVPWYGAAAMSTGMIPYATELDGSSIVVIVSALALASAPLSSHNGECCQQLLHLSPPS